jgi:16S rRNA (guanine966-N2)-methyltransferase
VREALFGSLEARGRVRGARVLDLYCGSGALGLEAASRGAAEVVMVDTARAATTAARANVAALDLPRITVVMSSVERYLTGRAPTRFDLVLLDPPYRLAEGSLAEVLAQLVSGRWLVPGGLVVVERSGHGVEPSWPAGLGRDAVRRYGDTAVWTAAVAHELPHGSLGPA